MSRFREILSFIRGIVSDPDGTPSSTRCLMFVFSLFTLHLLWKIFDHLYQITDVSELSIWLANIPLLIASLIALIALPYTINRGAGAVTDSISSIANIMASKSKINPSIETKVIETLQNISNGTVQKTSITQSENPNPNSK